MPLFEGLGAAIAGGLISGASSAFGASRANTAAQEAAQRQMEFQRESAQNSYQWAMADMKSAGLNPMLAYQRGGAAALSGASYTPQNIASGSAAAAGATISSALQLKRFKAELTLLQRQGDKTKADRDLASQQGMESFSREQLNKANLPAATSAATAARIDQKFWDSKLGKWVRYTDLFGRGVNPFANVLRK